ncbi:MAG: T9SS type A sorting domain-containing protein [Lewinellaceae bacterium]|nr:T9SS type A sorting domain-containing protein [Lewinellaceae bacterium]
MSRMVVAYYGSREEVKVGIFPNPAKERLTVAHAGFSEPQPVAITDMLGTGCSIAASCGPPGKSCR